MIYVMSDIHGCYDKYRAMLDEIGLCAADTLYILGDVIDRGPDSVKLLFDMMCRENVVPIIGNHEYMCYKCLKKLAVEITDENYATQIDADLLTSYSLWLQDGGMSTMEEFRRLQADEKEEILDYLSEFSPYEYIEVNGRKFVLVHAGLDNFNAERPLYDYRLHELIFSACDPDKVYFNDRYLVTGHRPTFAAGEEHRGKIIRKNNHISIDCGAVFGEKLGCIRLDDLKEFYI